MAYPQHLTSNYSVLNDPEQSLRTQIDDIISSYNSPWDPLTELIQNSVDAINARKRIEGASFTTGKIEIIIDSTANTISVEDNGAGIPAGHCAHLLIPGGTLKRSGNTYGHKGLGFTYCAHIAEEIEVDSIELQTGAHDHWKFSDGFKWLNDPTVSPVLNQNAGPSVKKFSGAGTVIKMKFAIGTYEQNKANTAVLDKFFEWADDEKLLAFVLRTRTAVGQVFDLFGQSPSVSIEVVVNFINGARHGINIPFKFFDFFNYPPLSSSSFPKASDYATNVYQNHNATNKVHFGIYHLFDSDPTKSPPLLRVGKHHGGVKFAAFMYCCGKDNLTSALENYDTRLVGDFKYLSFSTDVLLAIDGMPCGVPIDQWNNFGGFEQRYFCIINADISFGKVLDAGRKTITRYYVDLFTSKVIELTKLESFGSQTSFYKLSQQLHHRMQAANGTLSVTQLISRWKGLPILNTSKLSMSVVPNDELSVYMLFGELCGKGLLPGYKIEYISGVAPYDMALSFEIDLSQANNINSSAGGTSTLGPGSKLVSAVGKVQFKWQNPTHGQSHLVAECKVDGVELLRDISARQTQKSLSEIDFLICIDIDAQQIVNAGGSLQNVSDASREFTGVTHKLLHSGKEVHVIALKSAIEKLIATNQL